MKGRSHVLFFIPREKILFKHLFFEFYSNELRHVMECRGFFFVCSVTKERKQNDPALRRGIGTIRMVQGIVLIQAN
jgi:hypothetical protein